MKGKPQYEAVVSMVRRRISAHRAFCVTLLIVLGISYFSHRFASYKMNTTTLYKSPITDAPRDCAKPGYAIMEAGALPSPDKICITTLTDAKNADMLQRLVRWRNFDSLLEMTWPNKQAYAKKHGYRLFDESGSLDNSRPPSWSKIRAAQRLLKEEGCEWVVWWDADTVIMNSDKKIQDFLPKDKDLLLTKQKGGSYNAGAWIIKNTPWSHEFLNHWWNMKEFVHPKGMATSGDNAALKSYLLTTMPKTEFEAHIGVPPRCTFNSVTVFMTPSEWKEHKDKPVNRQQYYMHPEKYHKGDLLAHVAGKNNKIDTTAMLLKEAV